MNLTATNLGSGVDCQQKPAITAGMGRLVLSRMFGTEEGKLVVVNVSGGISLARGGYGIAYGRIMAGHDAHSTAPQPPYRIGDLSVKITDSRNVTRPARLSWASAGWGSLNFVVPANSATGSARLTIERADGSQDGADVFIADTAQACLPPSIARGPPLAYSRNPLRRVSRLRPRRYRRAKVALAQRVQYRFRAEPERKSSWLRTDFGTQKRLPISTSPSRAGLFP